MSITVAESKVVDDIITSAATITPLPRAKPRQRPFLLQFRSSRSFILLTVGLAIFVDLLAYSIIIPIIPFIIESIHSGTGYQPNVDPYALSADASRTSRDTGILLTIYAAGLLSASPLFGIMGDRMKTRQFPMLLGIFGMILSTIIFMFANQYWLLLIARFFQGISAACIWTLGLCLVADTIPSTELGVEMGKIMVWCSIALVAGPPIGGALYATLGPKAPFIFCLILATIDYIFRSLIVEKRNAPREWFENGDVETITASADLLLSEKPSMPVETAASDRAKNDVALDGPSVDTDECKASKVVDTPISSEVAAPTHNKIRILALISQPRMIMALLVTATNSFLFGALEPTLTLRLVTEWGLDTKQIGLVFISQVAPAFIFGPGAGWLSDRYGPKIVVLVTMILTAMLLFLLPLPNKDTGLWPLLAGLVIVGSTGAAFITPVMAEIATVVNMQGGKEGDGFARSYAIYNIAFSFGFLVGPISASVIYGNFGFFWVIFMISTVLLITIPCVYLYVGERGSLIQRRETTLPS